MRRFAHLLVTAAVAAFAAPTFAQSTLDYPSGSLIGYFADSGPLANDAPAPAVVFSRVVEVKDAAWIRLHFVNADLAAGSLLRVTSLLDGEVQELDAAGLARWSKSTAYFNGDRVHVELIAGPNTRGNRIAMERLATEPRHSAIPRGGSGQCGICGPDNRAPSVENWSCRIMPVGCTASVFCEDSSLVTAGHCVSPGLVAQFNVPASTSSCDTVNPPVAEQFPVIMQASVNGGVGNDWGVLQTSVNNLGQTAFQRYGQLRRVSSVLANVGNTVTFNGYGIDLTCPVSQTQQLSTGSITARNSNSYQFNADVRGGNSGSGMIVNNQLVGIVTHCSTGCPNYGTRMDVPAFVTARNNLAICDGPVNVTISSSGAAAVPVTVTPPDNLARGDGVTNFTRTYNYASSVTLTAPAMSSGQCFQRWTLNGAAQPGGTTITFPVIPSMFGNPAAVAIYASCCACDWNHSGVLNSQDYFDFLNDFFASNADFNGSGVTNSQDYFDFLACFFTGC